MDFTTRIFKRYILPGSLKGLSTYSNGWLMVPAVSSMMEIVRFLASSISPAMLPVVSMANEREVPTTKLSNSSYRLSAAKY